ncbi:2TM domain-containing protein [Flavobacterium sp.]|uniref:2TM domain-containing protein n=1 Tax=Flavobacterium sp. TaxID=239 RepID=UPI002609439F|nr:2TM domain-containing protein [Flavobacterium sp.]
MELIMETNQDFEKYQKAKKQVEEIKGFYSHLAFYVAFNLVIVFINLKYSPNTLWFFWTTFSWGIGVFFHAVKVFNWIPLLGKDWEQKKLQQFMDEERNKSNKYQ